MSQRKLSRRQSWRVQKIQDERIARAQRRDSLTEGLLGDGDLGPEQEGLVLAHFGVQVEIEEADGRLRRCHKRANIEPLVTGDRVVWQAAGEAGGVVTALLPRHSLLQRPDNQGRLKPVAANIDVIVLVVAPVPAPSASLIDRYLVACEAMGIPPLLLLNKADLLDESNQADFDALLAEYRTLGYEVLTASATERDVERLKDRLSGHTCVFVGQSGVGKSSLINALLPDAAQAVQVLSSGSGLGQHTTTTARLFHFPSGGDLIDSPGIREFALWHIDYATLLAGFREFQPWLGRCRFRNCAHRVEPGCALQAAAEAGQVSERRLESFHRLVDELAAAEPGWQ